MVRRLILSVVAGGLLVLALAPQAAATVEIRDVDVSSFPRVTMTVSSEALSQLSERQIMVRENGILVSVERVTTLGGSTRNVDAVLAIDVSNSMRGSDVRTALEAAKEFLGRVPSWLPVGVVAFSGSARVVSPITTDRAAVMAAVDGMTTETSSGTALYDAIGSASALFDGPAQHNLIVLTDGRNTTGSFSLNEAVSAAAQGGLTVFTLGLDGPDTDQAALQQIARQTDGDFRSLSASDLDAAYASLAARLGQQFVITYRSKVPYGMPATITVGLPDGSVRTKVLMPAQERPGSEAEGGLTAGLFRGDLGLGLALALTFLAAWGFASLVAAIGSEERRRRSLEERLLARRVRSDAGHPERRSMTPRPIADAAARGAAVTGASRSVLAMLERADWSVTVGEFLAPSILLPLALGAVLGVMRSPLLGAGIVLVLLPLPFLFLSMTGRKRLDRIREQLPDVMMVLASSLRAGHSFLQALDSVAKEIDEPASSEFARALSEIRLGRNVDDALNALAQRAGGQDLEWAVTAINIQRKVGGNLAEVLETVAGTIRERQTIRRQVKVLSAEGRLSVSILFVLPFGIAGYLAIVNPDYLSVLTGTVPGNLLLIASMVLMLVGLVWMRKVVRLDV
jgi:tight adherence protein B